MLTYDKKNVDSRVVISSPWDFETMSTSSQATGIEPAITLKNAVTVRLGLMNTTTTYPLGLLPGISLIQFVKTVQLSSIGQLKADPTTWLVKK